MIDALEATGPALRAGAREGSAEAAFLRSRLDDAEAMVRLVRAYAAEIAAQLAVSQQSATQWQGEAQRLHRSLGEQTAAIGVLSTASEDARKFALLAIDEACGETRMDVIAKMTELHEAHRHAPGVIKMWRLLQRINVECGRNRVARLRAVAGIETLRHKRFKNMRVHQKVGPADSDLVKRGFAVGELNKVWVGDMTLIRTRNGSAWLAVYIDLCTHRVIGWAMAPTATAILAMDALQKVIKAQQPQAGVICHPDQGVTYGATLYRELLQDHMIRPSMSRKGNCHDNAVAESFFSNLNNELTHHYIFDDAA